MRGAVVTLFGGSGFIGRHVVKRLAARGAVVRVPTRRPDHALHLKPLGDVGQIVLQEYSGEVSEQALAPLFEGTQLLVNLVGILFERRPGDFQRIHAELPRLLGVLARTRGVERVVHVSALGADPASPALYARTKAEGEARLRELVPQAVVLRPSVVFGPEDQFFNRFAFMSQLAPVLPIVGGKTRFQPVYVGDVADAVAAALSQEEAQGRLFELGGPRIYTFEQLLRYMLEVLGRRRLVVELPEGLARFMARFFEWLPNPPLTRDQIALLKRDNVVSGDHPGLAELGIAPTPLETVVPTYLVPYARQRGRPRTVDGA